MNPVRINYTGLEDAVREVVPHIQDKISELRDKYHISERELKPFYHNSELILDELIRLSTISDHDYKSVCALWACTQSLYLDAIVEEFDAAVIKVRQENPNARISKCKYKLEYLNREDASRIAESIIQMYISNRTNKEEGNDENDYN